MTTSDWLQLFGIIANSLLAVVAIAISLKSIKVSDKATAIAQDALEETRNSAIATAMPSPVAYLTHRKGFFVLVIKNNGGSTAKALSITTNSDFASLRAPEVVTWPLEVSSLPVGITREFILCYRDEPFRTEEPIGAFTITISFYDHLDRRQTVPIALSFDDFQGSPLF